MKANLLEDLRIWQQQGNRHVGIDMGGPGEKDKFRIFVYDYDLQTGQYVQSADEIDLEGKKREEEKAEFERLKKQFEGETIC